MTSPLFLHEKNMGARFGGARIPLWYTNPVEEYWAIRNHSGMVDVSDFGLLQVTGKDRLSFLNGLLTNEVLKMSAGTGIRSALLNTKARVLADLYLYGREDDLIIDTGDVRSASVKDILDRFIITEEVQVKDVTSEFVHLTLQGQYASENARELFGVTFADMNQLQQRMLGPSLVIARDRTGQSGYDLIIPNDEAEAVWQGFLLKGVAPVGLNALEILRLEAGYPRYGIDVDENIIILEAGYKDAISFNKGCYLGQEVVARATHIGRVNKNLVQFQTDSDFVPVAKAKLHSDGKEAGYVTSAAFSPAMKGVVGLGYAQRDFAKVGTRLVVESDKGLLPTIITKLA